MQENQLLVQFDLNEVDINGMNNNFDISAPSGATFGVLFFVSNDAELLVDIDISNPVSSTVPLISEGPWFANQVV